MAVELLNIDCMEYMRTLPDKAFELAIVDPPYGIDWNKQTKTVNTKANWIQHDFKDWDSAAPEPAYFDELQRVSKNQAAEFNAVDIPLAQVAPKYLGMDEKQGIVRSSIVAYNEGRAGNPYHPGYTEHEAMAWQIGQAGVEKVKKP